MSTRALLVVCCMSLLMLPATAPAASAAGKPPAGPSVRCTRTGALFTPGESATFTFGPTVEGPVTVSVRDYFNQEVMRFEHPAEAGKPAAITIDTSKLPRLGFHQMTVRQGDFSATTSFAIVPPAKDWVDPRNSKFGADFSSLGKPEAPDVARSLRLAGVRWIMTDIPLAHLNPREGVWDWETRGVGGHEDFDAMVKALHREGIIVQLKFLGQADYLSARTDKDVHAYWDPAINLTPPKDYEKWAQVVTAVVKQYGDVCDHWEIGNEPDGHGYFKGTDDDYIQYLLVTSKTIRAAQPSATIVAASMYTGGGVLGRLCQHPDAFDIMSVHYLTGPWGDISKLSKYQTAQERVGIKKPIWNTEARGRAGAKPPKQGEESHMGGKGADNQSCTKAYVRNFAMGIPRVFVFSWNEEEAPGMVLPGYAPQPNTVEFRTMADQLDGSTFVREVVLGADASGYVFERGGEYVFVGWTDVANTMHGVEIPSVGNLTITDTQGNSQTVAPSGPKSGVTLEYRPVFVRGVGADFGK